MGKGFFIEIAQILYQAHLMIVFFYFINTVNKKALLLSNASR